jgi:hypothetical protein
MIFLVEFDHVKQGVTPTPEAGRAFIERIILPTLARAGTLLAEKRILAGGPALGRISLRFIVEADSPQEVDQITSSLPLWPFCDVRVTPLIAFGDRHNHVQAVLKHLNTRKPAGHGKQNERDDHEISKRT